MNNMDGFYAGKKLIRYKNVVLMLMHENGRL